MIESMISSATAHKSFALKKRILVIEDNPDISRLLLIRLESHGYDVVVAGDGAEGLERALQAAPDLIILDLYLPKMPGEDVCKAIREHADKKLSRTPIIMLTSKRSEVDRIIGMVIGANAYIEKPFDPENLLVQISKLVR